MNRRYNLWVICIGLALLLGGPLALLLVSYNRGPVGETRQKKTDQPEDTALDALRELFLKGGDVEAARSLVGQLNQHLERRTDDKLIEALSPEQLQFLQDNYYLDSGELAEVSNRGFTLLDAHYLEQCSVANDAIRSLRLDELPPLEKAKVLFDWVCRQVSLSTRHASDTAPPLFVLRRGSGSSLERALVFLALLDQIRITGCMISVPFEVQGQTTRQYWIPGAVVGDEIYLFDTRMGMPLPADSEIGIATYAQLLKHPEKVPLLNPTAPLTYDVGAKQAQQALVHVACGLSPMAARMQYLQDVLAASDRIILRTEPRERFEHVTGAVGKSGGDPKSVRAWNLPGDLNTPTRAMRSFLPPGEGGVDKSQRRDRLKRQLIPDEYFPRELQLLPGELRTQLLGLFGNPFIYFRSEPKMPLESVKIWLPGLFESKKPDEASKVPEVIQSGRMPRDLVLRGRFDECTTALTTIRDELSRQIKMINQPGLGEEVLKWCDRTIEARANLLRAERGEPGTNLPAARQAYQSLISSGRSVQMFLLGVSAIPMSSDVLYLIAIVKHEQATRANLRIKRLEASGKKPSETESTSATDAWRTAASWWTTYLDAEGKKPEVGAARLQLALARASAGETATAIELLQSSTDAISPLENTANLIRAAQIGKKRK